MFIYGLRLQPNGEVYLYSGREYNFPNSIMIWMCISNSGPNLIRLVPEPYLNSSVSRKVFAIWRGLKDHHK